MKYMLVISLLVGLCAGMLHFTLQTEMHADRWAERLNSVQHIEKLNEQAARAREYSEGCFELASEMSNQVRLLSDREYNLYETVKEFEEENRALKKSLNESVKLLEDQVKQINDLIDENGTLSWKIQTLERQINTLEKQLDNKKSFSWLLNSFFTLLPLEV